MGIEINRSFAVCIGDSDSLYAKNIIIGNILSIIVTFSSTISIYNTKGNEESLEM